MHMNMSGELEVNLQGKNSWKCWVKQLHLLQLPCEFDIINQIETLITYQKDLNIWTCGKDLVLKKYQRCEDSQSYCQLMEKR